MTLNRSSLELANGTALTTGNTGASQVTAGNGATASNEHPHSGTTGAKLVAAASNVSQLRYSITANASAAFNAYYWLDAAPTAGSERILVPRSSSARICSVLVTTGGKLLVQQESGTTTLATGTVTLPFGSALFRVETWLTIGTAAGRLHVAWYLGDSLTPQETFDFTTANLGSANIAACDFGRITNTNAQALTIWLDDPGRDDGRTSEIGPAVTTQTASVSMASTSTLAAAGTRTTAAAATMASSSTVTAAGQQTITSPVTMAGTSTMSSGSALQHPAGATMSSSSTVSATGASTTTAPVTVASASTVSVDGLLIITPTPSDPVTYDTVTTGFQQTVAAGGSMAFPHIVNPGVTVLVVAVQASASSGANTAAAVTYAGVPLTRASGALSSTTSSTAREDAHWVLVNPPPGTADVRVTARASGTTFTIGATALSLVGASGDIAGAVTAAAAAVTSITGTTSSPTNSLVVTSAAIRSTTPPAGGGGTTHLRTVYGTNNAFVVSSLPGGSATSTYTWTTADQAALVSTPMLAQAPVTMRSTSSMTAGPATGQTASAGIDSTSALNVQPAVIHPAAASFTSTSALAAAATGTAPAAAAMAGTSAVTVTPLVTRPASIPMSCSSAVTASPVVQQTAVAMLAGSSTLTVGALVDHPTAITMDSSSAVTTAATAQTPAGATLAGGSAVAVAPLVTRAAQIPIAGGSTLAATSAATTRPASAVLASSSTVSAGGRVVVSVAVSLAGTSELTTAAERTAPAAALIGSTSYVAAGARQVILGDLAVASTSDLAVAARQEALAQLLMVSASELAVDGQDVPPVVSGPSARFLAGPFIRRPGTAGPGIACISVSGPAVPGPAQAGSLLIARTTTTGPHLDGLTLTGPEIR